MPATRQELVAELAACADPARAELGLSRLFETVPDAQERLRASPTLARTVITVMAASPFLTRTCVTGPMALDVLAQLDVPLAPLAPLSRWKGLEQMCIRDRLRSPRDFFFRAHALISAKPTLSLERRARFTQACRVGSS